MRNAQGMSEFVNQDRHQHAQPPQQQQRCATRTRWTEYAIKTVDEVVSEDDRAQPKRPADTDGKSEDAQSEVVRRFGGFLKQHRLESFNEDGRFSHEVLDQECPQVRVLIDLFTCWRAGTMTGTGFDSDQ